MLSRLLLPMESCATCAPVSSSAAAGLAAPRTPTVITHNAHTDRLYALSLLYPQSHARLVTECSVSALQHFAFLRGAGESVTFASKPPAGPLFIRNSRETCGALALGVVDGR